MEQEAWYVPAWLRAASAGRPANIGESLQQAVDPTVGAQGFSPGFSGFSRASLTLKMQPRTVSGAGLLPGTLPVLLSVWLERPMGLQWKGGVQGRGPQMGLISHPGPQVPSL